MAGADCRLIRPSEGSCGARPVSADDITPAICGKHNSREPAFRRVFQCGIVIGIADIGSMSTAVRCLQIVYREMRDGQGADKDRVKVFGTDEG